MTHSLTADHPRIRVLLSGHLPPPFGGIATFCQSLMNSSLSEKVELSFVQTSSQKRSLSKSGRATIANIRSAGKDCLRFLQAVRNHRPQITHITTAYGLSFLKNSICVVIARFLGSRVLLHPHCSAHILYYERSGWWRWYFRQILRLTDGVVALSKEWAQLHDMIPTLQVYYLPNAIDLKKYQEIAENRRVGNADKGVCRILYLGYMGKAKGSLDLIEAAGGIVSTDLKAVFDLVGDELTPGEGEQLQQLIRAGQLNHFVTVYPPAFGADKLDFLRKADIFVYPSYYEGTPMAILEAMASGLPIVATNVGGIPEIVRDGCNGFLVSPGDIAALKLKLTTLIQNSELRAAMGRQSRKIVEEEFDLESYVERLVALYRSVAAPRGQGLDTPQSQVA